MTPETGSSFLDSEGATDGEFEFDMVSDFVSAANETFFPPT